MGLSEKTIVVIVLAIILIFMGIFIIYFVYNKSMFNIKILFDTIIPKILSQWRNIWDISQ